MAKAAPRNAVLKAMSLLADITGSQSVASSVVRSAVVQMTTAGSYAKLAEECDDPAGMVRGLLAWNGNQVGDEVVDAAVNLLSAEEAGRSLYSQAVSLLSYAAVVAPLVDDATLLELIDAATYTPAVYGPIRYTATVTVPLRRLLGHYPQEVRQRLLISLWEVAHEGRWWSQTITPGRRYQVDETEDPDVFAGGAAGLLRRLGDGTLTWQPMVAAMLGTVEELTPDVEMAILQALNTSSNPDTAVLSAYVRPLPLDRRPESPILLMVETLAKIVGDDEPETVLPRRPVTWGDLYPRGSTKPFPIPEELLSLDGTEIPGIPGSLISVVRHQAGLSVEHIEMGNRIWDYVYTCERGKAVVLRLEAGTEAVNVVICEHRLGVLEKLVVIGKVRGGVEQIDPALEDAGKKLLPRPLAVVNPDN